MLVFRLALAPLGRVAARSGGSARGFPCSGPRPPSPCSSSRCGTGSGRRSCRRRSSVLRRHCRGVAAAPLSRRAGARVAGGAPDRVLRRARAAVDRVLSLARRCRRPRAPAAGRDALCARGGQPAAQPAAAARTKRSRRSTPSPISPIWSAPASRRIDRPAVDRCGVSGVVAHGAGQSALHVGRAARRVGHAGQPLRAEAAAGRRARRIYQEASCEWEIFEEVSPFFAEERRLLHAGRGDLRRTGPADARRVVGSIVVHVMLDYSNLSFISAQSPYVALLRAPRHERTEPAPREAVEFTVYGWSRRPLYMSGAIRLAADRRRVPARVRVARAVLGDGVSAATPSTRSTSSTIAARSTRWAIRGRARSAI